MPSLNSETSLSIFLSYAREDKDCAEQFKEILNKHGIQVWIDEANLRPLEKWAQEIKNAILSHDYLIFLASRSSTADESFCREEIKFAKQNNKTIIPINIDPKLGWLPEEINDINWINFSSLATLNDNQSISLQIHSDEFNRSLNLLLTTLETDLDWVKLFTKLLQKSWEWDENERNDSYLLIGDELKSFLNAVKKYEGTKPEITSLQDEFLKCSQQYEIEQIEKQRKIRKRLRIFGLLVTVLLLVVGISLFINWRQNIRKVADDLMNQSRIHKSDVDLSLLLGYQAYRMVDSNVILSSLFENLEDNNYITKIFEVGRNPVIAVSDNRFLLSYCIKVNENYCETSELRFLGLDNFQDLFTPFQISGQIYNLLLDVKQNVMLIYTIENGTDETIRSFNIDENGFTSLQEIELNSWAMIFGSKKNQVIISTKENIYFWDFFKGNYFRDPIQVADVNVTGLVLNEDSNDLYSVDQYGILAWDLDDQIPTPKPMIGVFHNLGIDVPMTDGTHVTSGAWVRMTGSDDGKWLVTQERDGLIVWDTETLEYVDYIIKDMVTSRIGLEKLTFIPGTSIVVFVGTNENIYFYDVVKKETLGSYAKHGLFDLKFSSDGRFLFLAYQDGNVVIYDSRLEHKLVKSKFSVKPHKYLTALDYRDDYVLVGEMGSAYLYNFFDSSLVKKFFHNECNRYQLSPDNNEIAVGCQDGTIKIIDIISGNIRLVLPPGDRGTIESILFTPDSSFLMVLDSDGIIAKYDLLVGHEVWHYQLDSHPVGFYFSTRMSTDGRYLVFPFVKISGDEIGCIDITGETPKPLTLNGLMEILPQTEVIFAIGISPDSSKIVFSTSTGIYIYDINLDKVTRFIPQSDEGLILTNEFIDDEKIAVTIGSATSGMGVSQNTGGYSFSHQEMIIYDITDGNQIGVILNPHEDTIFKLIQINSSRLMSASLNGDVRIWDFSSEQLQKAVCLIADRELTQAEWDKYIGKIPQYQEICNISVDRKKSQDFILSRNIYPYSILGKSLSNEVVFLSDVKQKDEPLNPTNIKFAVNNDVDTIISYLPALLQCKQRTIYEYSDTYVLYWPFAIKDSVDDVVNTIEEEVMWKYPDGTSETINLHEFMTPGKNSLLVFEDHLNQKVLLGPKSGTNAELVLSVKNLSVWNDPGSYVEQVIIEPLSAQAHPNITQGDLNFPMHSLRLMVRNLSDKDIRGINLGGIVYNIEGKPIDFFLKTIGGFTNEYTSIPAGESRIIGAQSLSQSGRCVGYGFLEDPFKIDYYLGFYFSTEQNEFPYGTLTGEISVEK